MYQFGDGRNRESYRIMLERRCGCLHPTRGLGCVLPKDHDGPHLNEVTTTIWARDGESGVCGAPNNKYGVGCRRDKGHDGKHRHYNYEWE